ncbi:DUF6495 family protein [Aquimarina hainanensis]|uniref:DUF6495 family protein n=1 Tax=Aquimarina hainanensis TaxID=1578017 RepID=A0ABW5NBB2_9FLAO|nr:DUF6495 family protein [Aquimarina sp. TRL1]QKX07670.1 hypothetical protein HN014_19220 [Aquimarina sp. TRL1]
MKYIRLTKEQLEEMHQEFINFLATQSITAEEWEKIKKETPEVAEEEIDIFSDMIWEGVLNNVQYLEHFSKDQIHLFHTAEDQMYLIAIKVDIPIVDLTTREGYDWLRENLLNDKVTFYDASKPYSADQNLDKFKLISEGAQITKGALFRYFDKLIHSRA